MERSSELNEATKNLTIGAMSANINLVRQSLEDPSITKNIDMDVFSNGWTALMYASFNDGGPPRKDDTDILRLLLNSGANPNIQNNNSWTALMIASYMGQLENVKLLLEYDADPTIMTTPRDRGVYPIHRNEGEQFDPVFYINWDQLNTTVTGYYTASKLAEKAGHTGIVKIINKYTMLHPKQKLAFMKGYEDENSEFGFMDADIMGNISKHLSTIKSRQVARPATRFSGNIFERQEQEQKEKDEITNLQKNLMKDIEKEKQKEDQLNRFEMTKKNYNSKRNKDAKKIQSKFRMNRIPKKMEWEFPSTPTLSSSSDNSSKSKKSKSKKSKSKKSQTGKGKKKKSRKKKKSSKK